MANVVEATYQLMSTFWTEFHRRKTQDGWIADFIQDVQRYCYWTVQDSLYCLGLALFFTALRYALTNFVLTVRTSNEGFGRAVPPRLLPGSGGLLDAEPRYLLVILSPALHGA